MIALYHTALPIQEAFQLLQNVEGGAIDIFIGTTRKFTNGSQTETLFYEAYEEMAVAELQKLAERAKAQWEILTLVIWHRVGEVPLGEASVLIGVTTKHRAEAFAATRFLIDELKNTVPIWKKEHFADGTKEWV